MINFDKNKIKLVAFDLNGTLTQHKTPLSAEHRAVLDELSKNISFLWPERVCVCAFSAKWETTL